MLVPLSLIGWLLNFEQSHVFNQSGHLTFSLGQKTSEAILKTSRNKYGKSLKLNWVVNIVVKGDIANLSSVSFCQFVFKTSYVVDASDCGKGFSDILNTIWNIHERKGVKQLHVFIGLWDSDDSVSLTFVFLEDTLIGGRGQCSSLPW